MFIIADLIQLAKDTANKHAVDPSLFCALCDHESQGWQWAAVRYEAGFYARYIDKMVGLTQTEKTMRATSFGLGQVMGQTAREYGFDGHFLTELLEPSAGLEYACRKLARCLKNTTDINAALLEYNGGGNPSYPALVLANFSKYKQ